VSPLGRHGVPLAAGLAAAAAAFAAVAATTDGGGEGRAAAAAANADGLAVFARMGCGGCHTLAAANASGAVGPDLDTRLQYHTRESLVARITSPREGTAMPTDFAERMSDAELDALVDFLLAARAPR
jgi:mono/diheme cytochrome c family protein